MIYTESLNEYFREQKNILKEKTDFDSPHNILKENDIVIGNYRFEREGPSDQWLVTEVSQISSVAAWHPIFRFRWKGRLNIAVKGGIDFYKVLRLDYTTDWIALLIVLAII